MISGLHQQRRCGVRQLLTCVTACVGAVCAGCTSPGSLKAAAFECGRGADPKACTLLLNEQSHSPAEAAAITNNRGVAYSRARKPYLDLAAADFTAVIDMAGIRPIDRARAWYNRGLTYSEMNPPQFSEAIDDLTAAAMAQDLPLNLRAKALNQRAHLYATMEPPQWDNVIADGSTVISMSGVSPEQRALAYVQRAKAYLAGRMQYEAAAADLSAVMDIAEAPAAVRMEACIARGDAYAAMQPPRWEQAIDDYTTAIETKGKTPRIPRQFATPRGGKAAESDGFIILEPVDIIPPPGNQRAHAYCRRADVYARMHPPRLDEAIADCTAALALRETTLQLRYTIYHQRALLHDRADAIGHAALDHCRSMYATYLDDLVDFCRRRAGTATLARKLVHEVHQTGASKNEIAQTLRKLGNICERNGMPVSAEILNAVEDKPVGDEWR